MISQFFRDSFIYSFGKILTSSVSFLLIPLYTRLFVPADFGIIDLTSILATLVSLTVALEIDQAMMRFLADAQTRRDRIAYSSTTLWFSIAAYGAFVLVGWALADYLSYPLYGQDEKQSILRVAVLMMGGSGLFSMAQNQLRWQLKSKIYTLVSLSNTILALALTAILVLFARMGVVGVFWGQLIGSIIGLLMALFFSRHDYGFVFEWSKCREMLRFSLPLVPSGIGVFIYLYIDRILIKELMTLTDLGLFGVGYRITSIVGLLMFGTQIALTPLVYSRYHDPQTPQQIARIFRIFVAGALLLAVGLSLFVKEILVVLTTPEYYSAWIVVPFLVPATALSSMYIFAPGLGISKKTGSIAMISIGGGTLNLILNLILIPVLGIQGAALATLFSSAAVFTAYMIRSQKLYYVPHVWSRLIVAALIAIAVIVVGTQLDLSWWGNLLIKIALSFGVVGLFVIIGLLEIGELSETLYNIRFRNAIWNRQKSIPTEETISGK